MNEDIANLQRQIDELKKQLTTSGMTVVSAEAIRDVVFPDNDSQAATAGTATTQIQAVVNSVNFGGSSVTTVNTLKAPNMMLRVYFRGNIYNIPVYNLV